MRRELFELLIIFFRFIVEAHADLDFSKPVKDCFAGRGLSVRILQDLLTVAVPSVRLIDLTDHAKRSDALDPFPLDGVGNGSGSLKVTVLSKIVDLLKFYSVFSLIHYVHPYRSADM